MGGHQMFAISAPPPPHWLFGACSCCNEADKKPQLPLNTTINMYGHAGLDEATVKWRGANWLSGIIEQHPASKWRNTYCGTLSHSVAEQPMSHFYGLWVTLGTVLVSVG